LSGQQYSISQHASKEFTPNTSKVADEERSALYQRKHGGNKIRRIMQSLWNIQLQAHD